MKRILITGSRNWTDRDAIGAAWNDHGKSAGPLRNQEMVDAGADVCLAFPTTDSRGTWDCVHRAEIAGIPVVVVRGGDEQ